MAGGGSVELVAHALLKIPEFDHLVAHYVGVRGQSLLYGAQGIGHHVVPVFLMQGHNVEGQVVACGYKAAHLYVLLGSAVAFVGVEAYAYVK